MSSGGQIDGDGLDRQRDVVAAYAKKTGVELVAEFVDAGVSGTLALADRPGLSELLAKILGNGVRLVLVEKADRLARDLVEGELLLREFRRVGVSVIEAEGGTNLSEGDDANPTAKLIRQVLGAVAEFEKSGLVLKLRAARRRVKAERGRCEGAVPFGEREGEAGALERLIVLSRKPRSKPRRSLAEIAACMNEEGWPTRRGGPWSRSTVQAILQRRRGKGK